MSNVRINRPTSLSMGPALEYLKNFLHPFKDASGTPQRKGAIRPSAFKINPGKRGKYKKRFYVVHGRSKHSLPKSRNFKGQGIVGYKYASPTNFTISKRRYKKRNMKHNKLYRYY